jgi:hypothetical protein
LEAACLHGKNHLAIATLPEEQQADVVAFIRLKMTNAGRTNLPDEWQDIQGWFDGIMKTIHRQDRDENNSTGM